MHINRMIWLYIALVQACLIKLNLASEDDAQHDLIVQTLTGPIEGIALKSLTDEDVIAYYGIPYAEPPIGDLRFKPPVPIKPWTKVLKATKKPLPCYQQYTPDTFASRKKYAISRPWSEDCLTLNVWIPRPIPNEGVNIPILVFLHGGNFQTGSNLLPFSDGNTLAAHAKVFAISVNYRLGPFGFLGLGHPDAPGNMGLMDQQLAIRWVKENTPKFGGPTGNIIPWGLGAGGASVGYQILSPGSAGLFTSASVRSGSPLCPWAFQTKESALRKAQTLVNKLGCQREDMSEQIECLRNQNPEDILDADIEDYHTTEELFKPTVDGTFITEPPIEALRSGNFNNVSVLSVTNADEGSLFLKKLNPEVVANATNAGICPCKFRKLVKRIIPDLTNTTFSMIQDFYVDKCDPKHPFKLLDAAVKVYSDIFVDCCMESFIDYLSQKSVIFRLVYEQVLEKNPKWMGTVHATDQLFFHGYPLLGERAGFTAEEGERSKELIMAASYFSKNK